MTIRPTVPKAMVVISTVVLVVLLLASSAPATSPPEPLPTGTAGHVEYTVAAGDTLWVIAGRLVDPGEDRRPVVDAIRLANGLEGSVIHPGQVLTVPAG